jgi:hypothetical protein
MAEHPDGSYLSQSSPVALSFLLGMGLDQRAGTLHHATVTTAFAYLRVSGKGQIQGDGFPRQLTAIKGYAHGLSLLANYTFAKNLSNAPAHHSNLGTPDRFVNTPQFGTITEASTRPAASSS